MLDLDGDLPSGARQSEPVILTLDQGKALLQAMGDEFRPIAACCLYAGLRVSEALGLTWADVDLGASTLTIHLQLGRDGRTLVAPKSRASGDVVVMPAPLVEELRAHRRRQFSKGLAQPTRLVFVTRRGTRSPGRRNTLRAIQTQADHLGLRNSDGELLGAHDLRHSCAGILRALGFADEQIAVVLRHANSGVTRAMYGGWADVERAAVRAEAAAAFA